MQYLYRILGTPKAVGYGDFDALPLGALYGKTIVVSRESRGLSCVNVYRVCDLSSFRRSWLLVLVACACTQPAHSSFSDTFIRDFRTNRRTSTASRDLACTKC